MGNLEEIEVIEVPEEMVVEALGKAEVEIPETEFNVPKLHILVVSGFTDDKYDAMNMEIGLHADGDDIETAMCRCVNRVVDYITSNNIKTIKNMQDIIAEQDTHTISDYWRLWRFCKMQATLDVNIKSVDVRENILQTFLNMAVGSREPEKLINTKEYQFLKYTKTASLIPFKQTNTNRNTYSY